MRKNNHITLTFSYLTDEISTDGIESVTDHEKEFDSIESNIINTSTTALENLGAEIESANAGIVVYCCLKCEKKVTLICHFHI